MLCRRLGFTIGVATQLLLALPDCQSSFVKAQKWQSTAVCRLDPPRAGDSKGRLSGARHRLSGKLLIIEIEAQFPFRQRLPLA